MPQDLARAREAEPTVTVVIPTFNRARELRRALDALRAQTEPVRVIVVDNGSTDDTGVEVAALAPSWQGRLEYVLHEPRGPAAARNTGIRLARTPFVLFHDSDVELPPDWVERALAHLRAEPSLGAAGGFILYAFAPGLVNAYGGDLGWFGLAWDVGEGTPRAAHREPARRVWINCSAMLARAAALRDCGGFDETFFYAHEDTDLGWRMNVMGTPVKVFPDLEALHHVDADPGRAHGEIVFHYCKNRLRSLLKNASAARLGPMAACHAAYAVADALLRAPRRPKWRALAWNLAHLRETLALRRGIQSRRRMGDRAILGLGSGRWLPPSPLAGRRRRPVATGEKALGAAAQAPADDRI